MFIIPALTILTALLKKEKKGPKYVIFNFFKKNIPVFKEFFSFSF